MLRVHLRFDVFRDGIISVPESSTSHLLWLEDLLRILLLTAACFRTCQRVDLSLAGIIV